MLVERPKRIAYNSQMKHRRDYLDPTDLHAEYQRVRNTSGKLREF